MANVKAEVNAQQYLYDMYLTDDGKAYYPKFTENADGEIKASIKKLDCNLYNLTEGMRDNFSRRLTEAVLFYTIAGLRSDIADIDEKQNEKFSSKRHERRSKLVNVLDEYERCTDNIDAEKPDCNFICAVAQAITGNYDKATNSIVPVINACANGDDKRIKQAVNVFTHELTREHDAYTRDYVLNCNSKLLFEVKAAYYRGRKLDDEGFVHGTYDKKGNNVRHEIIFAIVQYMQSKRLFNENVETGEEYDKRIKTMDGGEEQNQ